MTFRLTHKEIKQLCGQTAFKKGEAYHQAGHVTFTHGDADDCRHTYTAMVTVNRNDAYQVHVDIADDNGNVKAVCTCPTLLSYKNYCQHIAAVLLSVHDMFQVGVSASDFIAPPEVRTGGELSEGSAGDRQLTDGILSLFNDSPQFLPFSQGRFGFDTRVAIDLKIACGPVLNDAQKYRFGIAISVGLKRLHGVQKIREFLNCIQQREPYVVSKNFTYDGNHHYFQSKDDAVIQSLIQIYQNEQIYSETSSNRQAHRSNRDSQRLLVVPPSAWETLQPLLAQAPLVKFEHRDTAFSGISLLNDPISLHFELTEGTHEDYQLHIRGLDEMTVMESYGMVVTEGNLLKLPVDSCKRLSELQQMLGSSRPQLIQITPHQLQPFMDKVIPGLMKLGHVQIAPTISNRILQTPLKARLYLDRVNNRLLAGLEFQYGDIVLNPLETSVQNRGSNRILLRALQQEQNILDCIEQSPFAKTDGGYFMDDEEAEYDFLYHVVPQLEKMAAVYATSAVKVRLHTGHTPIKITVDVNERTEWLEFHFQMDGIPDADIRNLLKSLEEKRKYYRLPNGSLIPLEDADFQEIRRFMEEMGLSPRHVNGTETRLPLVRGLHLLDSHERGTAVKLGKSFRRLLENMRNPDDLDFPVPDSLVPILRDYQKYGFQWLKTLAKYRFGGILADEMGLGKTLQSITFIVSVLPEIRNQSLPALIVCPASLVYNWYNEMQKFAPEIRTVIADGNQVNRATVLTQLADVDVVITSYPLVRRDIKLYAAQFFHTLILDEAQTFKNHTTQTAKSVKVIQAHHRFALTGTPVENALEELWSIYDVVFPALFPSRKEFANLTRGAVAQRIRPFLLRRLKSDVLKDLPEKIETLQASVLLPDQKKLYVAYLAKLRQETVKHLNKETFQRNRIKILAGLTRLRQLCCHPALFVEGYTGSSAKFEQLLEIVAECRSAGKRMLIFSQFTQMLNLIGRELGVQGVSFFYLDGHTPAPTRVDLCDLFNEGERDVFLISLKAGGTGLNLTGADTVILYDLWWNPAVEQQAADRAHRIGQKNIVQIIRLVAQGTVEDKMYELQQKKQNLIEEIIKPGEEGLSSLSEQEIREILMI